MKCLQTLTVLSMIGVAVSLLVAHVLAGPSHSHTSTTVYFGTCPVPATPDGCRFTVELDSMLFRLNSVQNKYRLVRIQFRNAAERAIALSSERDIIEATTDAGAIKGIFSLKREDPTFWGALESDLRDSLAYPEVIEAKDTVDRTGLFYAWFPADKLTHLPKSFDYRIDSVSKVVDLAKPPETAD